MADQLDEATLYKMELRLIKKHFPGLKPRPVKIDNTIKDYGQAAELSMILNLKMHRSKRELRETIMHELIHYELRDSGKHYPGHGPVFLRRAKDVPAILVRQQRSSLCECILGAFQEDPFLD